MPWTTPPGGVEAEHRYTAQRRPVGIWAEDGSDEQVSKIERAAVYGPADEIRVVMFEVDGIHLVACQNAIRNPGAKRSI